MRAGKKRNGHAAAFPRVSSRAPPRRRISRHACVFCEVGSVVLCVCGLRWHIVDLCDEVIAMYGEECDGLLIVFQCGEMENGREIRVRADRRGSLCTVQRIRTGVQRTDVAPPTRCRHAPRRLRKHRRRRCTRGGAQRQQQQRQRRQQPQRRWRNHAGHRTSCSLRLRAMWSHLACRRSRERSGERGRR